jgi:hypothetical protein
VRQRSPQGQSVGGGWQEHSAAPATCRQKPTVPSASAQVTPHGQGGGTSGRHRQRFGSSVGRQCPGPSGVSHSSPHGQSALGGRHSHCVEPGTSRQIPITPAEDVQGVPHGQSGASSGLHWQTLVPAIGRQWPG